MKCKNLFLFIFIPIISYLKAELNINIQSEIPYNKISGEGSQNSVYSDGFKYLSIFNLNFNNSSDVYSYNLNLAFRTSNETKLDYKNFSFTNLKLNLKTKNLSFSGGDVFESFSQYSLASSVKGISLKLENNENIPEIIALFGYINPDWDNFPYQNQVYGLKVSYDIFENLNTGVNFVYNTNNLQDSANNFNNLIYSLNFEYRPLPAVVCKNETAFSNLSQQETKENGYATKFEIIADAKPSRVSLEYSRITPKFLSVLGSATPDRERISTSWRYIYSKNIILRTSFLWYRNNLDNNLTETLNSYTPEISLIFKNLFNRKYSELSTSYKINAYRTNQTITDNIISLNYKDKFSEYENETSIIYNNYQKTNINETSFRNTIFTRTKLKEVVFKPSVSLGFVLSNINNSYDYNIKLSAEIAKLKMTSDISLGQNFIKDLTKTSLFSSIYTKPEFLNFLKYGLLFVKFSYTIFDHNDNLKDFNETNFVLGFNLQI